MNKEASIYDTAESVVGSGLLGGLLGTGAALTVVTPEIVEQVRRARVPIRHGAVGGAALGALYGLLRARAANQENVMPGYNYDYVDPYALPVKLAEAWQRKEGKNPEGGLNEKGRRSLKAKGQNIKRPVSAKQAKKSPKAAASRKSFCARMGGMPGPMKDEKGRPTRKALALRKWDCRKSSAALTWDKVKRSGHLVVVAPDAEQGRMLDYPHPKEGRMVRSDLYNIALDAMQLRALLRDDDNLPQWTQSKLAVARDRVNSVREYLEAKIADHEGFEFGLPKLSESRYTPGERFAGYLGGTAAVVAAILGSAAPADVFEGALRETDAEIANILSKNFVRDDTKFGKPLRVRLHGERRKTPIHPYEVKKWRDLSRKYRNSPGTLGEVQESIRKNRFKRMAGRLGQVGVLTGIAASPIVGTLAANKIQDSLRDRRLNSEKTSERQTEVRSRREAKIADHEGFEFGLPKLSGSENEPTNPKLWSQMQSQARKKFKVHPSAYSNGWAAKEYKKRGGGWRKKKKGSK